MFSLALVLIIFMVLISVLVVVLKNNEKSKDEANKLPPGYIGLPFIGETFAFMKPHSPTILGEFMDHHIARWEIKLEFLLLSMIVDSMGV